MKPFIFNEKLVPTIWGGSDIISIKNLDSADAKKIGESWEISGVAGGETLVAEGEWKGKTLTQLIEALGAELMGKKNLERYGTTFPLLIKFISAAEALSIQVHPDDEMAGRMGHPYGKTEMWYLIGATPEASLCSGFKADFSAEAYTKSLEEGTLESHLAIHKTQVGDCFFIPAGRIHSIGAGNFIVEIQQSSNDTFRVYDFDRVDAQGNKRELHIEQAKEALNYKAEKEYRTHYERKLNEPVDLVSCEQFTTRHIEATQEIKIDYKDIDSFVILIAYEGEAEITDCEGNTICLKAGKSMLLPASNQSVSIAPRENTKFSCLETFVV